MSSAAMALLQGDSTNVKEGASEVPVEEATIKSFDKMTGKEIDAIVKDNNLDVPKNWSTMKVAEKQKYMSDTYSIEEEEATPEEAAPAEPVNTEAEEQVAVPVEEPSEPAPEPEPAAEVQAEGTSTEVTIVPEQQVIDHDEMTTIAKDIENLDAENALKQALELTTTAEVTYFRLGGVFNKIKEEQYYKTLGFKNFKQYVETVHGIKYRKAMYWADIYNGLIESGVDWALVKGIGWTKLKEVVGVITKDNVKEWVGIASSQTAIQLAHTVKDWKKAQKDGSPANPAQSSVITTKTFKVHADQKENIEAAIAKAKEIANTEFDTVALEMIALDYLAGTGVESVEGLAKRLQTLGPEKVAQAVNKAFDGKGVKVLLTSSD